MRRVLFVFASVTSAALACGLTADFGGLQGGERDAGVAAPEAGAPDADAGEEGFCDARRALSPVKLCADFDEEGEVNAGWDDVDVSAGATLRIGDVAFSPPGALESAFPAGASPASARLYANAPSSIAQVHAEFRMLLEPSDADIELFVLHQTVSDGTTYGVYYKESSRNLLLYVRTLSSDGGKTDRVRTIGPPPATWLKVEIDFDVSDAATVVVKHDGAIVLREAVPTSTPSRTSTFFALGLYSFTPQAARARFDDVIFDWK